MDAEQLLTAATAARELIATDEVARRWDEPSALEGYTVGGLSGHLARGVFNIELYLEGPEPSGEPTDAAGYFAQVLADHDPVDSDLHEQIRARSVEVAAVGASELTRQLDDSVARLVDRLPACAPNRRVTVRDGIVLTVEEYLATRLVELVVHLDDLAVSIGSAPAGVPDDTLEETAAILARIAARRTSPLSTVRSLARRERHADAVRAF